MRWLLSTFIAAHGIAHLVGFAVSWRLIQSAEVPFTTTLLNGRWDVGERGIRIVGGVWLAVAMACVIAAGSLATETLWAWRAVTLAVAASLVLCLVSLPAARIGLAVNLALVALLASAPRIGLHLFP
jgi:hypothetical protein